MYKTCSKCHIQYSIDNFYLTKSIPFSWCKMCCKQHQKQYDSIKKRTYIAQYRNSIRGKELRKEWLKRNKDRCATYKSKRRAAEGSHTALEWENLKDAYCYKCYACNRCHPEIELTKDHIVPLSKGGSDYIENIVPLCRECNGRKGAKNEFWYLEQFKTYGVKSCLTLEKKTESA